MKVLWLIPSAILLWLGGEGLYHAFRGRERAAIDCQALTQARPSAHQLHVTGCEIDYAGVGYRGSNGIDELFFPARPAGRAIPAPIVIVTRNPAALALAQTVLGARATAPERSLPVLQKVVAIVGATQAIDGLARAGAIERLRTRRIVSGLTATPVAIDAVLIDLDASPDFLRPLLALVGGLLVAAIPLVILRQSAPTPPVRRRLERDPAAYNAFAIPQVPHVPPSSSSVALPRLLLLNLGAASGPESVESAPPLGARDDVIEILRGAVPDLAISPDKRMLSRADNSLRIDLGLSERVATAVVESRGEAGSALVREILLMTGWRAFAPKTGLFVTGDELAVMAALTRGPSTRS